MRSALPLRSILVLCEGNHCRSPIAEGLLRAALPDWIRVESAGLGALVGHPAAEEAQAVMAEAGHDLSAFRGRQLTGGIAMNADLILVMDREQKDRCERQYPSLKGRVFLLGSWLPGGAREIADPFRRSAEAYREAFDLIQSSVAAWLPHIQR